MSIKSNVSEAKQQTLQELGKLRDEAKVRLHLLSLEARQRWDEMEAAVLSLEQRASQDGGRAAELLSENVRTLTRSLSNFIASEMSAREGLSTSVRSVMSSDVRGCAPEDSLNHAAHMMWEGDCGIVPVLQEGLLVGLLTDRDVCMATYTQGKAPTELSVGGAMSQQIYGCSPDDSLGSALSLMAAHRIRRLPVLTAQRQLAGMLSLADIIRFARRAGNPGLDGTILDCLAAISTRNEAHSAAAE